MTVASNSCPINRPLDVIHDILNLNKDSVQGDACSSIQDRFVNEILTEETERMISAFETDFSAVPNYSLVKVKCAAIVQDCLEDEFFQPFIKSQGGELINAGLWTRSLYCPRGDFSALSEECNPDYSKLQVRKRILACCKKSGKSFIIALYPNANEEEWEKWRQETFKMNSMHSLVGIYEAADEDEFEVGIEGGLSGTLPTLHLFKRCEYQADFVAFSEINCEDVRARLIDYLSICLKGNKEAAESLMLFLVSRPSMRVDGLVDSLFIGKLCVNLCCKDESVENSAAEELKRILENLKEFVVGPIEVESSAEGAFTKESIYPSLNVQNGQITPGAVLQQPDGCVLILDESKLREGEFKDQAVRNLQALIDLIRQQHVNYDFGMQQVTLKTDMPAISVSVSKKSVLPFDLRIDCDSISASVIDEEEARLFRSYLHHCRLLNCSVTEDMAVFLEQDYLALRKSSPFLSNGNPKMNEQEFHRLMNLARLAAVSRGQSELTKTIWEETKSIYYI